MSPADKSWIDTAGDRRANVLRLLSDYQWHTTAEISAPAVGGAEGCRRLRELRAEIQAGELRGLADVEKRRKAGSTMYEYRIVRSAEMDIADRADRMLAMDDLSISQAAQAASESVDLVSHGGSSVAWNRQGHALNVVRETLARINERWDGSAEFDGTRFAKFDQLLSEAFTNEDLDRVRALCDRYEASIYRDLQKAEAERAPTQTELFGGSQDATQNQTSE